MREPQTRTPDRLSAHHSSNLSKYQHPSSLYRFLNTRFLRALMSMTAQSAPVAIIEAGCGEGFVLRALWQSGSGHPLIGYDRSIDAVRYARQAMPAEVCLLVADVYHPPFRSAGVDLVICSEVLEHLAKPDAALAELARLSRRAVLISVPREPWFRMLAALAIWLKLGSDPGHVQFWSGRGFARLLLRHFADLRVTTSSIYRLALARVRRSEGSAPWYPGSGEDWESRVPRRPARPRV
jgi:SAM-dependent methyltransferase